MKKLLLTVAAIMLMATSNSFAQGKISFGIGADVAIPMTTAFSNTQSIGIGGTARGYYLFNDMVSFTATAGYLTFSGKDQTVAGVTINGGKWSMIPVVVGARYYFSPAASSFRPYGAFEIGLIFSSYTIPSQTFFGVQVGGGSVSGSDFTYQPQVGFEASKFDVSVRLLGVANATCVAARVGYIFN